MYSYIYNSNPVAQAICTEQCVFAHRHRAEILKLPRHANPARNHHQGLNMTFPHSTLACAISSAPRGAHQGLDMTHNHSTQNGDGRSIASIALKTAGLIGAVILCGVFVALSAPGVTDVDAAVATPTRAQTKTAAETVLASASIHK